LQPMFALKQLSISPRSLTISHSGTFVSSSEIHTEAGNLLSINLAGRGLHSASPCARAAR
jgi:hypothetical protein